MDSWLLVFSQFTKKKKKKLFRIRPNHHPEPVLEQFEESEQASRSIVTRPGREEGTPHQ